MNKQQLLLTIVSEECSEVHQRCSKAARFGMSEIQKDQPYNNAERILHEFNDLVAAMEMLFEKPIDELVNNSMVEAKKSKVEKYLNYSVELGQVV